MGLNAWFRDHPVALAAAGFAIAALGLLRGQPAAIAIGAVVVLYAAARFVLA